jgi:hypothetical protein
VANTRATRARLSGVRSAGFSAVTDSYALDGDWHWQSIAFYWGAYTGELDLSARTSVAFIPAGLWLFLALVSLLLSSPPQPSLGTCTSACDRALIVLLGGCVAAFDHPLPPADRSYLRPDWTWLFALGNARVHRVVLPVSDNLARNSRAPSRMRALRVLLAFHVASTLLMVRLVFALGSADSATRACFVWLLTLRVKVLRPARAPRPRPRTSPSL